MAFLQRPRLISPYLKTGVLQRFSITPIADATPRSVVASIFLLITGIKKASIYAGFQTLR